MKRVLCIISCMNTGGAETFLMKVYRKLDRQKYQMDFCVYNSDKGFYEDEINNMGGKIFHIPAKTKSFVRYRKALTEVIESNHYENVIRITSNAMGFLDLKIAKLAGAKKCVARSSNSSDGESALAKVAHTLGRKLYSRYVDVKIAPSDLAAIYTFGEEAYKRGEIVILHNGLDLAVYRYNEEKRHIIRNEFSIDEKALVIGHIGRFAAQKNHKFLLEVFKQYYEQNKDAVLMLVGGNGELECSIRKMVNDSVFAKNVIFTGVRSDIPALLSAMDVFIMPSFYEGMPNTVIEAQATGLPCLVSDTITKEANITGNVVYLPLGKENIWISAIDRSIKNQRNDTTVIFENKGYAIEKVTDKFVSVVF